MLESIAAVRRLPSGYTYTSKKHLIFCDAYHWGGGTFWHPPGQIFLLGATTIFTGTSPQVKITPPPVLGTLLSSRKSDGSPMHATNPDSLTSCLCFRVFHLNVAFEFLNLLLVKYHYNYREASYPRTHQQDMGGS